MATQRGPRNLLLVDIDLLLSRVWDLVRAMKTRWAAVVEDGLRERCSPPRCGGLLGCHGQAEPSLEVPAPLLSLGAGRTWMPRRLHPC